MSDTLKAFSLTAEDRENIGDRPIVASVSGGKDSGAMALWLLEQELPFTAVYMDTGWEHEATSDYVRGYLPKFLGQEIEVITPKKNFVELIRHKQMFPGRVRRFCTQELKIRPFERWVKARYGDGRGPVNAIGIRAAESRKRSTMPRWRTEDGLDWFLRIWRPLIDWTEADVIAIHQRHGMRPNPLYLTHGVSRVGCWPCIHARKSELRRIAEVDPDRIALIAELEHEIQEAARLRYEARGETFESLGYTPPTMFTLRDGSQEGRPNVHRSIDEMVAWAKTGRGGSQLTMDVPESGCVRWGMCDLPPDVEEDS